MSLRHSAIAAVIALVAACGGQINDAGPTTPEDGGGTPLPGVDSGPPTPPSGVDANVGPDATFPPPFDSGVSDLGVVMPVDVTVPPTDAGTDVTIVGVPDATGPETGPMCATCAELNVSCGAVGDGCGNVIECGTCDPPGTCGGAGIPGACGSAGNLDVSGTWTGTWAAGGINGAATLVITEMGATVTGTASFANEPCFASSAFTATIAGTTMTGTIAEGANMGALSAEVSGNVMTGTATPSSGGCAGVMGTFKVTR